MKTLHEALLNIRSERDGLGGSISAKALEEIGGVRRSVARLGIILFVATLIVFGIVAYGSLLYIKDPKALGAITGGLGLSLGAALEVLRRTWKEWGQVNLLMILLSEAREDQVKAMVDTLIKKI